MKSPLKYLQKYAVGVSILLIMILAAVIVYYFSGRPIYHKYGNYVVVEIRGALTHEECDALVAEAGRRQMMPSQVVSQDGGEYAVEKDSRNSVSLWMKDGDHAVARKMGDVAETWTRIPRSHQEWLQIVKYDEGGKFDAHYDPQYGSFTQSRRATLLLYLNDDYEGGATHFVKLGLKITPEKGKAILFWNLDEKGQIIEQSMHRGEKVERGHKWICTKWIHNIPFVPPPPYSPQNNPPKQHK